MARQGLIREAGGKARVHLRGWWQGEGYSERLVARQGLIWEAGGKARVILRGWWHSKG